MQAGYCFKIASYASTVLLVAVSAAALYACVTGIAVPIDINGRQYRVWSSNFHIMLDDEPQIALKAEQAYLPGPADPAPLVRRYNELRKLAGNQTGSSQYDRQVAYEQAVNGHTILQQLAYIGYVPAVEPIPPNNPYFIPAIKTNPDGSPVYLIHPQPAVDTPFTCSLSWAVPILATAILPFLYSMQWLRDLSRRRRNLCRTCGYDMRATPHRCPECGSEVAATAQKRSFAQIALRLATVACAPLSAAAGVSAVGAGAYEGLHLMRGAPITAPATFQTGYNSDRLDFNTGLSPNETTTSVLTWDEDTLTPLR